MITLKKIIPVSLLCTGLMLITAQSYAECDVSSSGDDSIGRIPSITLAEIGIQSNEFNAGLSCEAFATFATTSYIKYRVDQMPVNYINSVTGETLVMGYVDTSNRAIDTGSESELGGFSLVNLFSGPGGSLRFKARINPGQSVSPGIYRADKPFKVKWYYSVPGFGIGPLAFNFQSNGFRRPFWPFISLSWGSGNDATINLTVEILPDCRISTNDVNLGTAAFADAFVPVQTSMGIRCSAKTSYNVGLNNGLNPQGSLPARAMKSELGNNYLRYEIYKNSSTERWGSNGSERWSSANATTNAGNYDAITQQGYTFTTKILENNLDNLPAGKYSDTVTVQVEF